MERKTTTLNFATKTPRTPRKGKIFFFGFKPLKNDFDSDFLGALGALAAIFGFLVIYLAPPQPMMRSCASLEGCLSPGWRQSSPTDGFMRPWKGCA